MRDIDVHTLHARLAAGDEDLVVLDCREAEELRAASLPGAVHVPMQELPGHLAELDPDREYAVLCHHGIRSRLVCAYLYRQGFAHVLNILGGIDAYAREVDPSVGTY